MSELLALSFDVATAPSLHLGDHVDGTDGVHHGYGWGVAWYAAGERAATVVKDPRSTGENAVSAMLREWDHFRSTAFVAHLRGAAQRLTHPDTQPFVRAFAGRDWLFAHNGDLDRAALDALRTRSPAEPTSRFEPLGSTDSEVVFSWLLEQFAARGARCIADLDRVELAALITEVDGLGTANLLLTDGEELLVHRDDEGFNGLCWSRILPPHKARRLESSEVAIDFDDPTQEGWTGLVVSTRPLSAEGVWTELVPGQTFIARRGEIVWSSHPDEVAPTHTDGRPVRLPQFRRKVDEDGWRTLEVHHGSTYRYAQPVDRSSHVLRLAPVIDDHQQLVDHQLTVSVNGERRPYEDVFGNRAEIVELAVPYSELSIVATSTVRVREPVPFTELRGFSRPLRVPPVWMPWQRELQAPYLLPPELPETQLRTLFDFAMSFVERNGGDLFDTVADMNRTIYRDFGYVPGSTGLATTPFEVFTARQGVCQDFANLLICLARLLDLPARYRVGYVYTGGGYENRIQSDASHAWTEIFLPYTGWRGFDPTNGVPVNTDHVRVACGRTYLDATPTSGTIWHGGGNELLTIDVRVTDPFADDEDPQPGPDSLGPSPSPSPSPQSQSQG
ncbi:MAG: class II glutamine amidotransferase [Actinomycetota bacterium]